MTKDDRRSFQRLKLAKPIQATLDARGALILDIGIGGAFVEHRGRAAAGLRFRLGFRWRGQEIAFDGEVVRSSVIRETDEGPLSHSAVTFTKAHGHSDQRLAEMMATFVGHLLAAQRANATGGPSTEAAVLSQLGDARRARSHGFIRYRWDTWSWSRESTADPKQPVDGFTVAAYEDEEELITLCETYELADEEGRSLIRLVAELSVRSVTR